MSNNPPYTITNKSIILLQDIAHELGILSGAKLLPFPIHLRRNNQIKTIHSSLAIEGNTLTIEQITDVIEGKRVFGPKRDIIEVSNAVKLYNNITKFNPLSINSLLEAHKLLMHGLIADNGSWRGRGVGIFKDKQLMHLAPGANRVSILMENLFKFIKQNNDISWLIKACVFHYELEFIHPFTDGNGRMGRLWQQLLLIKGNPVFQYIPVETLILSNQEEYYNVLAKCDSAGESTMFIEFMANHILAALKLYTNNLTSEVNNPISRIEFAKMKLRKNWFSRKDYILLHKDISTATASRDLNMALQETFLISRGAKNQTYYKFK